MKQLNNLIYSLEINYTNNSGSSTSIYVKCHDNGLEIKSIRVGNVCITEETTHGRILSGRYDNIDIHCGYRYDYQNGENLLNLNTNTPIETAISLINKTKMESEFLSAKFVLNSILRNDFNITTLNCESLKIIKTIYAENENSEHCSLQESFDLLKLDGKESLVEQNKKKVYKIGNKCIAEENQTIVDNDIKSQLNELVDIINQNPRNYKDLMELKNKIYKNIIINPINEGKVL